MALRSLPRFTCLPEEVGQHRTTTHILPPGDNVLEGVELAFQQASAGQLPSFPTIEMYFHTTVDPTLSTSHGLHSAALFVQWVPYALSESSWEEKEEDYVKHLMSLVDQFAPGWGFYVALSFSSYNACLVAQYVETRALPVAGFSHLVVDTFTLTPPKIEQHFGITHGVSRVNGVVADVWEIKPKLYCIPPTFP